MIEEERQPTRQQRWRQQNRIAYLSHLQVQAAVRRGEIVKPDQCERCGKVARLDGHHHDHRQPLRLEWLCRSCHVGHHRRRQKGGM